MDSYLNDSIKSARLVYSFFLSAIIIWCSLILIAPLLAKFEYRFGSGLIYLFFSKICHQIPERSFFIFGKQLAVCSRCTGLYLGFLLGTILYPFISKLKHTVTPSAKYLFIAGIPIAVDILIRIFRIAENSFASRLITGFILGMTVVFFVLPGIFSMKQTLNLTLMKQHTQTLLRYPGMILRKSSFRLVQRFRFFLVKIIAIINIKGEHHGGKT